MAVHPPIASRATLLACLCGFVYFVIAGSFRFEYTQSWFAHHVLMADAMLHGQLAIRDEAFQRVVARAEKDAEQRLEVLGRTLTPSEREAWRRERLERTVLQDWSVYEGRRYGYWAP